MSLGVVVDEMVGGGGGGERKKELTNYKLHIPIKLTLLVAHLTQTRSLRRTSNCPGRVGDP